MWNIIYFNNSIVEFNWCNRGVWWLMITLTPERKNLWKNWIDNCFFIETFGLISEDTHTHSKRRQKLHYWVRASSAYFGGTPPQPRRHSHKLSLSLCFWLFWDILSGHTVVNIGKSKVLVFGGLVDKKFLSDVVVYDVGTIFVVVSHFYYRASVANLSC